MRDKDSLLIFEAYSESKDGVEDVVQQIRTTRYANIPFPGYVGKLFNVLRGTHTTGDVVQFVDDLGHKILPGDRPKDFKQKQADLVNRLIVALDYAGDDEDKLNHLIDQLAAAEERFQKGEDDDDDIPGMDDGDGYSVGRDIYATADRDDRAMPPR